MHCTVTIPKLSIEAKRGVKTIVGTKHFIFKDPKYEELLWPNS